MYNVCAYAFNNSLKRGHELEREQRERESDERIWREESKRVNDVMITSENEK